MNGKTDQTVPAGAGAPETKSDFVALSKLPSREDLEGAQAELERELTVRDRCYGRWVAEGRLAKTDAKDRYCRLQAALLLVRAVLDYYPKADEEVPYGTGTGEV